MALRFVTTLAVTHQTDASALLTLLILADWSQFGDFEMTTPIADLLQDISEKGIPTSKDEVSTFFRHTFRLAACFAVPHTALSNLDYCCLTVCVLSLAAAASILPPCLRSIHQSKFHLASLCQLIYRHTCHGIIYSLSANNNRWGP